VIEYMLVGGAGGALIAAVAFFNRLKTNWTTALQVTGIG
jgi:hypothetical protein